MWPAGKPTPPLTRHPSREGIEKLPSSEGWPAEPAPYLIRGPGWVPDAAGRQTHPAAHAAPLPRGDRKAPLLGGVAEGRGGCLMRPAGKPTPPLTRHPSREGIEKLPSLEGWPKAGVGASCGRPANPPRRYAAPLQGGDGEGHKKRGTGRNPCLLVPDGYPSLTVMGCRGIPQSSCSKAG